MSNQLSPSFVSVEQIKNEKVLAQIIADRDTLIINLTEEINNLNKKNKALEKELEGYKPKIQP